MTAERQLHPIRSSHCSGILIVAVVICQNTIGDSSIHTVLHRQGYQKISFVQPTGMNKRNLTVHGLFSFQVATYVTVLAACADKCKRCHMEEAK